ncbi:MAG: hypothetical protein QM758_09805 [Armatimonas sp.]
MKQVLLSLAALACVSLLVAGCSPQADTPPLTTETNQAKKMPGADTPPATTTGNANAARQAKQGN